ncbi:hypothetical protein Rleg9DRAFT_2646 [Rhizobium leguminosarum bv. trifolii WSM597]|uniref:Uncharacterized protein n=1 Tax=Rhizobium leguminosarum bv. trifolii WSM597 TaxID=754764 RepID=I9NAR7_RHILT|nr:hypothetical protein Rleg9DRAFT_2646 [Rhizobium leguminosarum bv. trifolii WSM597]
MLKPTSRAGRIWFYIVTLAVFLLAFSAARDMYGL